MVRLIPGLVRRQGDGVAAQVLTGLGADLERVRQQVIELLRGYGSEDPPSEPPGREDPLAGLELLRQRLAAIERWVGLRPRLDDLDQEIARVGRDKETAIDAQDFEGAVVLRDREKELLADKDEREKEWTAGPALADEVSRLGAELSRLRAILRDHGIEPGDDGAA